MTTNCPQCDWVNPWRIDTHPRHLLPALRAHINDEHGVVA